MVNSPLWEGWNVGSAFLLLAGASVVASAFGGALAFVVDVPPSWKDWAIGSAFIYIMLIAGASSTPARGGAFTFAVDISWSWTSGNYGSASYILIYQ